MISGGKVGDHVFVNAWTSGPVRAEIVKRQKRSGHIWFTIKLLEQPHESYEIGYEMTVRAGWLTR